MTRKDEDKMFNDKAEPTLNKTTAMKEISNYLLKNPKTNIDSIRAAIKHRLEHEGIIGEQSKRQGGGIWTINVKMSDEDALLVNECIYDLLYSRVITPGINLDNLELPFVHVSDRGKLEEYL